MADRLAAGDFLNALYDTALYDGDWRPALALSAELLASAEISLTAVDARRDFVTYETTNRLLSDEARQRYADHYGVLDPKIRLIARGGGGFLFNDSAYFDDSFVARDPFYQEFTRWVGTRHTLDVALTSDGSAFLAAMRTASQGPFQPSAERAFTEIVGHVRRVHTIRTRLDDAQTKARYAEAALDGLAYGLIVLDGEGRAQLVNDRARRLVGEGDALALRQDRLTARAPAVDRELQAMLERARHGAQLEASSIRLPRRDGSDWVLWVVRLPASSPLASKAAPGVLVMIGDSAARGRVRRDDLMGLYALTPAEAELALALGTGLTLREAAEERGVRYVTARSQLYAILDKTGAHRQADLARLIAGLPGAILGDLGA